MMRGFDATGVLGIREGWENGKKSVFTHQYKRALHVMDFLGTRGADRLMKRMSDYYYVIGHVRASTRGADKDANAHPFNYGHIFLVHNGTVSTSGLSKAEEDVDSAAIAATMAEKGETETLEKLDGGFSLVWYNAKDDSLNFARNDRKPMAIAFVKNRNELWYASEYSTLWNILTRNSIDVDGPIHIPQPLKHYKFFKESLRNFEYEGFKEYSRPSQPYQNERWNNGAKVHRSASSEGNQTGTTPPAGASGVSSSSAPSTTPTGLLTGPESTSTRTATVTIKENRQGKFFNPPKERVDIVNKILEPFGLKHDQTIVLKPCGYETFSRSPQQGIMILRMLSNQPDVEFRMSFVLHDDYLKWVNGGMEVACKIKNVMDFGVGDMKALTKVAVVLDEVIQGVLERKKGQIIELQQHGHSEPTKEDPKSAPEHVYEETRKTQRIVYGSSSAEDQDIVDAEILDRDMEVVEGPNGSVLTYGEFSKLCAARNCGYCNQHIDPRLHKSMSWYNGEPICTHCTSDADVQRDLQLDTEISDAHAAGKAAIH